MPRPASLNRAINRLLAGSTDVRHGEDRAVLAAGLLFFLLLTTIMILRPVREALGLKSGIEKLRYLFLLTLLATILLVPAFGWLASRIPRRMLLTVAFRVCAGILICFFSALTLFPAEVGDAAAAIYFVYHSVFNLFVVSLFWAFMADLFDVAESKRLFPAIAVGGSLGAIFGSLLSAQLADWLDYAWLFLVAAVLLESAVWAAKLVAHVRPAQANGTDVAAPIGGHLLAGITAVARSPYILGIAGFVVLVGIVRTFLYFTGLRLVEAATETVGHRTVLFAHINLWIQIATLLAQALLTGRIMRLGVPTALAVLPGLAAGGFALLVLLPTLTVYTLVSAAFQAAQVGITRPARETLFTVLGREQKYKAKSFIDTFFYRAGDATGAQVEGLLFRAGSAAGVHFEGLLFASLNLGLLSVGLAVLPITAAWIVLSVYLGRAQTRRAQTGR